MRRLLPLLILLVVAAPAAAQTTTLMSLDTPTDSQTIHQPYALGGWVFDSAATSGTGIDWGVVYAYPNSDPNQPAQFWGWVTLGGPRLDVGDVFGHQFDHSGFSFSIVGHAPGSYLLVVYAHSSVSGQTEGRAAWNVTVLTSPAMALDGPATGAYVQQPFAIGGWALDQAAASGTGVDVVHVWAFPAGGGDPIFVAQTSANGARSDVGAIYGAQFTNCGYALLGSGLPAGQYTLVAYAHSTVANDFTQSASASIWVDYVPPPSITPDLDDDGSHNFEPGITVTLRDDDPGATIWYRTDGGEPGPNTTPASTAIANGGHTPAITDAAHAHLRAKAFHGGMASATTSLDLVITSPRVAIDSPRPDQYVLGSSTVTVAGWALDLQAASGSGVDAVHVYGYSGSCGGTSTFLGVATYGFARPDVGGLYGNQFTNSGYTLSVSGLADGTWCLVPFAHSTVSGRFTSPQTVTVHVNVHLPGVTFDPAAGTYPQAVAVTISPTSPLPAGAVISYSTDGGSTWTDYDGTPVAMTTSGTTLRAYAHLTGAVDGETTVGTYTFEGWTVRYYHVDALGSVRLVTDQNGAVIERHDFLPFGDETLAVPPTGTPTFTGQERDVETKLDYFGARYLLPLTGRFTTPDPLKTDQALVNPQMWNRYAYVLNDPASLTDPSGMEPCPLSITSPEEAERADCRWDPLQMDRSAQVLQGGLAAENPPGGDSSFGSKSKGLSLKSLYCSAVPSGRSSSVSIAFGLMASAPASVDTVFNYNSGETSIFVTGGGAAGWNGAASLTAATGIIYGLDGTNGGFSGEFKGASFYGATPVPFVGAGGSLTRGGGVTVISAGASAALVGRVGGGISWTNTTQPTNLGKFALFSPVDFLGYLSRRPCN